ncbi:MAG: glycoside hydrolase family 3 protein [Ignavibacteria bacterium]|nr:glycoside hydrolase family 3 protein [Bacteroidota bacterium]MSQ46261.1 glycoside hydrolase family 3 protein [Ignavibacteria bacterium]
MFKNKIFILIFVVINFSFSQSENLETSKKVKLILSKMTIDEKIGQMVQIDYNAMKDSPQDIIKYSVGSILWGGDSEIKDISAQGWREVYDSLQQLSEKTKLKIPILFGIDAVHGHNNVIGATIFPHNIGLGATNNPDLVKKVASAIGREIKSTGIHWTFAPCVAVSRDERWGRTYESFGESPELISKMSESFVQGIQNNSLSDENSVLACVKHFVGDGGTINGDDQGEVTMDEESLRKIHLQGYISAIKSGAKSIMVSYNSWNGNKMHGHKYLLTDLLKNEMKFEGFLVSDWAAIDHLPGNYKDDIQQSVNAGLDLFMIPNGDGKQNNYKDFVKYLKELVEEKKVDVERIDDAVERILKVKYEMGLFEKRYSNKNLISNFASIENKSIAREAVRQSIVLLKNEKNILPLSKDAKSFVLVGKAADDVATQCGGWTIDWQGKAGRPIQGGTSILSAFKNSVSANTKIKFSPDGENLDSNDIAIVVIGEEPYAEFLGDRENLNLSEKDLLLIEKIKLKKIPMVVLLISGRPMMINSTLEKSNAFVALWLPGTEASGITDILFGDYQVQGKLPQTWPKNMYQIPINIGDKNYDPLFPFGYGLTFAIKK